MQKTQFDQIKNKFHLESAFSFANFTLLNGIFLVGFALALGADNFQIGVLMAIPLFANLLQLVSAFILEITGTRKFTTLISLFLGRVMWILIILIAFGMISLFNPIITLMVVLLLSSCFISIGNLSLLSWMKEVVPLKRLASFWGKRNMYATAGGMLVYIAGSYIIDRYESMQTYGYIFAFALFIGLAALFFLGVVPEKKKKIVAINPKKWWSRLKMPFSSPEFRPLLYFGLWWGFFRKPCIWFLPCLHA